MGAFGMILGIFLLVPSLPAEDADPEDHALPDPAITVRPSLLREEADVRTETRPMPGLCGLACLSAASKALNLSVDLETLADLRYIRGRRGSTLADLQAAAADHGLYARVARNLTLSDLRRAWCPMILRVKTRPGNREYDHYELFIPRGKDVGLVYDPPRRAREVDWRDLSARWNGDALAVSNAPISFLRLRAAGGGWLAAGCALGLGAAVAVWVICRRRVPTRDEKIGWHRLCAMTMAESLLLAAAAVTMGLCQHALDPTGFLGMPDTPAFLADAHRGRFVPEATARDVVSSSAHGAVLVDARHALDYRLGHLAGAINLPRGLDAGDRRIRLAGAGRETRLIVYCQSRACHFADEVAQDLLSDGFSNVSIYRDGWMGWQARGGRGTP